MSVHRGPSSGIRLLPFFVLALTSTLGAQQPMQSAWLEWANLSIGIVPDSGGTYLWVSSGGSPAKKTQLSQATQKTQANFFDGTLDPARAIGWIADARSFLTRPLTAADSGSARSSMVIRTAEGASIYLARRKVKGSWSPERILVMESVDATEPIMVSGNEESIGDILDSLEEVARRTPVNDAVVRRDSLDRVNTPRPLKPASGSSGNRPPAYPQRERSLGEDGTVLLSFVVGIDGRADMQSVKVFRSTGPAFLQSVLEALRGYTFKPATHNDVPVRTRVVMPFAFSLFRP